MVRSSVFLQGVVKTEAGLDHSAHGGNMSTRRRRRSAPSRVRSVLSVLVIAGLGVLCLTAAGPLTGGAPGPSTTVQAAGAVPSVVPQDSDAAALRSSLVPPASPTVKPSPPQPWTARWVMGYYVGYLRHDYPLEEVDFSALTHIAVGVAVPQADGSVNTTFDLDAATGPAWAKGVVKRAHQHGRKALLMLGGSDAEATYVSAASDAHRSRFVANVAQIVREYGFDGIDVDWEPLREADGPDLLALARELRAALPGTLLSIPLVPLLNSAPHAGVLSFYPQLPALFDQINLMTYGVSGRSPGWDSWHSSPLYGSSISTPISINTSVTALLRAGLPAAKLGVGIGFYGTCFTGVTGPNQAMAGASAGVPLSFADIVARYYRASAARWDSDAAVPYLTSSSGLGPRGCGFVSYENRRSIAAKADYARTRGLGGAIIWTINQGHLPGEPNGQRDPLLDTVRQAFLP